MPSYHLCDHCRALNRTSANFCKECGHSFQASAPISFSGITGSPGNSPTFPHLLKQRYRVISKIGEGGFSTVYQAEDSHLSDALRAVKEMLVQSTDPQEVQQVKDSFQQEARLLATLSHPHLPRVYDHFELLDRSYLVMDFIEGQALEDYLEKASGGKLPLQEVLEIGIQLCKVLDYLHTRRPPIIFRDLKPSNVMRTSDGHLYLIDFGIARFFKPGKQKDTIALGSPGYAAPEQHGRGQTTARADIYSLGATLHQLVSGRDPSEKPFQFPALDLQQESPAGPAVAQLIQQMVEIDEQKRPWSVQGIRQELQRSIQQLAQRDLGQGAVYTQPFQTYSGMNTSYQSTSRPISSRSTTNEYIDKTKALFDHGQYQEVLTLCDYALRLDPSSALLYVNKAAALLALKRYQEALVSCDQAIQCDPRNALAHYNASQAFLDLGRYQEALSASEQAIQFDPSYARSYINKAAALNDLGRYQEVFDVCDQALRYDPRNALAHYNAAEALIGLRRYQEALNACKQAIQFDPSYARSYINKSVALNELGRYNEALSACGQALRHDPRNALGHINASKALIELGRYQEALDACNRALGCDSRNVLAHCNAGAALMGLGRYQEALAASDRALQLDPYHARARANKEIIVKRLRYY